MPGKSCIWQYGWPLFGFYLLLGSPAAAAERVALTAGNTTWTVSLADVERWVHSGSLPGSLSPLTQILVPAALAELRGWLTRPVPLSPAQSQRFLQSPAGSQILARVGQWLIPPDPQGVKQAVTLLLQEQKPLTAFHLLQALPGETVAVDALAVANVLLNARTQQQQTAAAVAALPLLNPSGTAPAFSGQPWRAQSQVFTPADQPQRTLKLHLFTPLGSPRVPLVILSHGLGQTGRSLMYLGEYLASQGLAAAVITHPAQPALTEWSERPQDIRRVLAHLATQPLGQRLDWERVGLIGHSLGGYTVLVAAGAQPQRPGLQSQCQNDLAVLNLSLVLLQCYALELQAWPTPTPDPRIRAVIVINPAMGGILGAAGLAPLTVPVMVIGGAEDWVTPVLAEQIQPFQGLRGRNHLLVILPQAGHIDGLDELRQFRFQRLPPIPAALAHLSREFFRTHLFPNTSPLTPERLRQPTLPLRVLTAPP